MLEDLKSARLKRFYRYWDEKRHGRRAPGRRDIDPTEIADLLPNLFLLDVEDSPRRYRYRLVGTAFVHNYGEELTGRYVDDMDLGSFKDESLASLDHVVTGWVPSYIRGRFLKQDTRRLEFCRLALPLSSAGDRVDQIVGCMIFTVLER